MYGTIVLNNRAGRGLRRNKTAVAVSDILWCGGSFRAGEPVHLTFCGLDGGQYVIANGVSLLSDADLREKLPSMSAQGGAMVPAPDNTVVVAERDVELLW
jgi:hypothetical protein